ISSLDVGRDHLCLIDDGKVWCYGGNSYGQLDAPFISNPITVSAGDRFSCALNAQGVVCWGREKVGDVLNIKGAYLLKSWDDSTCIASPLGVTCVSSGGVENYPIKEKVEDIFGKGLQLCYQTKAEVNCKYILKNIRRNWLGKKVRSSSDGLYFLEGDSLKLFNEEGGTISVVVEKGVLDFEVLDSLVCYRNSQELRCFQKSSGDPIFVSASLDNSKKIEELVGSDDGWCVRENAKMRCWGRSLFSFPFLDWTVDRAFQLNTGVCFQSGYKLKCNLKGAELTFPESIGRIDLLFAGSKGFCGVDDIGFFCWANARDPYNVGFNTPPRDLVQISEGSILGYTGCVIAESKFRCWGTDGSEVEAQFKGKGLKFPHNLVSSELNNTMCLIDSGELKCVGASSDYYEKKINALGYIESFYFENGMACARTETQLHCWTNSDEVVIFESATKDTRVSLSSKFGCVLNHGSIECFGSDEYGIKSIPKLINPRDLVVNSYSVCALDDEGVKCWGAEAEIPVL
ncbi:MAG: hypothetical protein KDD25_03010, partial [Bdellovibrionales bacterium]|nr:hypothetical protein [Bdellovibrionales bacterium]